MNFIISSLLCVTGKALATIGISHHPFILQNQSILGYDSCALENYFLIDTAELLCWCFLIDEFGQLLCQDWRVEFPQACEVT
jgi:hypothetical protein